MNDSIISVKNLVKIYRMGDVEVHALRGVNLDIRPNDFVAIMGKSGSGKSTFMNILGCLDVPTRGNYFLDQVDVGSMSNDQLANLRNRKIGFVFQSFNLLSRTSALENVELPLMYNKKISSKEMRDRSLKALESVGLAGRAHHFPNQLSGGEQQRVAIARSLVNDPVVILADEPTGNLDTRTSLEVMAIFQSLNNQGITIVIVTHEADIAAFTKRNITFRDGKIIREVEVNGQRNAREELALIPVMAEEDEL
ncbi:MAG TPA: ABC transporter ATP-binding protein [Bacteroidales bacterium]|nr:ABC transporter ATP-binding protein [Bacteroidales bacterium]HPS49908.1 ABC transporter ATP-binding protein [Bacteroidales bacterium]